MTRYDRPMDDPGAVSGLFRIAGRIEPYPAEPSDAELAAEVGIDVDEIVRLDMNTLGGGPLLAVAAAAASAADDVVEYGDLAYAALRAALSATTGVPPHRIIPGAGADELIRLVTSISVGLGDAVVVPTPTFAMFAVEARLAGGRVVEVPRARLAERQPVAAIRAAAEASAARLVWLCSPNNPTGDAHALGEVADLAAGLGALVVVDEVYVELAEASAGTPPGSHTAIPLVAHHPNLLVLRSLSKAYGLAGARVGYLIAGDEVAARLDASRLPLAVAAPGERLAVAALSDPQGARERHEMLVAERRRVEAGLDRLGWDRLRSVANFVLFRPPDAHALARALHRQGVIVRAYRGELAAWLRVTIRSAGENDRFLHAIGPSDG